MVVRPVGSMAARSTVPEQPRGSRALNYKRVILQGTVGREPSHCRLWRRRYWCRGDEA